jgi:hypothetical protein
MSLIDIGNRHYNSETRLIDIGDVGHQIGGENNNGGGNNNSSGNQQSSEDSQSFENTQVEQPIVRDDDLINSENVVYAYNQGFYATIQLQSDKKIYKTFSHIENAETYVRNIVNEEDFILVDFVYVSAKFIESINLLQHGLYEVTIQLVTGDVFSKTFKNKEDAQDYIDEIKQKI